MHHSELGFYLLRLFTFPFLSYSCECIIVYHLEKHILIALSPYSGSITCYRNDMYEYVLVYILPSLDRKTVDDGCRICA